MCVRGAARGVPGCVTEVGGWATTFVALAVVRLLVFRPGPAMH